MPAGSDESAEEPPPLPPCCAVIGIRQAHIVSNDSILFIVSLILFS